MKSKILELKGMWLVVKEDGSKWVIDLDNMMFDNYKWYKVMGTLESEIESLDYFMKRSNLKRIYKEEK